jgi:hypothetical protein
LIDRSAGKTPMGIKIPGIPGKIPGTGDRKSQ